MTSLFIVPVVTQETLKRELLYLSGGRCSFRLSERDVYFKKDSVNIYNLVIFIKLSLSCQ